MHSLRPVFLLPFEKELCYCFVRCFNQSSQLGTASIEWLNIAYSSTECIAILFQMWDRRFYSVQYALVLVICFRHIKLFIVMWYLVNALNKLVLNLTLKYQADTCLVAMLLMCQWNNNTHMSKSWRLHCYTMSTSCNQSAVKLKSSLWMNPWPVYYY